MRNILGSSVLVGMLLVATLRTPCQETAVRPKITGISHVGYFVSDLPRAVAFWHDFLGFDEVHLADTPSANRISVVQINDHQFIELLREPPPAPPSMLDHICFTVSNLAQMRRYLLAKGMTAEPSKDRLTGKGAFAIKDPDGDVVEFVQASTPLTKREGLPASRISAQVYHLGFLVGNSERSIAFYRDVLGFHETWRGGRDPKELSWINMQVPDGSDYVEFMLYRKLPASYGSSNHISLVVPDVMKSIAELESRAYFSTYGKPLEMHLGVNGKRQVNLFDPDGTRVELMEPVTADGKPVASSTAPPPPPSHP